MKYTIDEFLSAAEQELKSCKAAGEAERAAFDYEKLGFVGMVVERLQGKEPDDCSRLQEVINDIYRKEDAVLLSETATERRKDIAHNRQRSLIHVSQMVAAIKSDQDGV